MQLKTARLTLRSMSESDLPALADLHADPAVMRYLGGVQTHSQSRRELEQILSIEQQTGLIRFALERQDTEGLIGYCGLKPAGEFVDLSYLIGQAHWGQGYAGEAATRVRQWGKDTLGLSNMEAGGALANKASIKILEALDFPHTEFLLFEGTPSKRFFD